MLVLLLLPKRLCCSLSRVVAHPVYSSPDAVGTVNKQLPVEQYTRTDYDMIKMVIMPLELRNLIPIVCLPSNAALAALIRRRSSFERGGACQKS